VQGVLLRLVKRAEFKRKQAPPGIKVTDRAFGACWRMPIASRQEEQEAIPLYEILEKEA
jgi:hypothetical protein